ncbi:MAG TPA: indole-3-glycerol phosphate synthase TrpC [Acidimicrobiales bacterium]|nr:indole-3-glycerol phosphate synthase TrpC [Acidimicrobiales bacterium]
MPPDTYLTGILASHRARAAADDRSLDALVAEAQSVPAPRPFAARLAVVTGAELAVIAEVKRRSPSKGALDADLDPAQVAADYEAGGAACASVLTDAEFFAGSPQDLRAARAACTLPVLRKDFTVCAADVCDARLMGADAVLLIVAALSDEELISFLSLAQELGLDALVEVHDEAELERALDAGAELVGVNQRDLTTFSVDEARAARLVELIPPEVVAVAESGIRDGDDVARLADVGYQAVLVGESLVRAPDRQSAVRALSGHRVGVRAGSHDGTARRR